MENLKNKENKGLPHFCCAGMQAPELTIKPKMQTTEQAPPSKINDKQKPWSVFENVYWI